MRLKRLSLVAVAALGAAALFGRRKRVGQALSSLGRMDRFSALAKLGAGIGLDTAGTRARKVFASAERREELDRSLELRTAEQVASALGNMKGALMKLGQLASYLDDGLPEPIREALASLQQDAPPMSPELAAQVVEQELGDRPERVFRAWDPVPIAAASIGQVHRALTQDGQAVAVKVQYPGVDEAIASDLDNSTLLFQAMGMLYPGQEVGPMVREIRERLLEELDYRLEAKNQMTFADYYRDHPFIHVPDVVPEFSTGRVLTTELVNGARFAELRNWDDRERQLAAEAIYRFVFRSLYRMHAFNGDPHPGNYLFHGDGRVTFLDFGLVKRFEQREVDGMRDLAIAMLDRNAADARRLLEDFGVLKPGAPMTDQEVWEWERFFYEPLMHDEPFAITHEWAAGALNHMLSSRTAQPAMASHGNLTPQFVILQRINIGLFSVLAELGAKANWLRVAQELWPWTDARPSTELGEREAKWLAARSSV